ncbi:hypothetical protein [Streptomyces sirii]|uniref:hypothetical protein n=1 Tax=Streptomyces sirii TaxID=3127701 RepID=UPI003D3657A7
MLHLHYPGPVDRGELVDDEVQERGALDVRAAHRFEDDCCFGDRDSPLVRGKPVPGVTCVPAAARTSRRVS